MINQYEAIQLFIENSDELKGHQYPSQPAMVIYATITHFTDYTKKALMERNIGQVIKCFQLAEKLLLHGDETVAALIEDSFVCSVFSVMSHHMTNWFFLKATAPHVFTQVYKKHLQNF